jgi:hypothetical protein
LIQGAGLETIPQGVYISASGIDGVERAEPAGLEYNDDENELVT